MCFFPANELLHLLLQTVVAVAMLVRRFNFQMAVGAPAVSEFIMCSFCKLLDGFEKLVAAYIILIFTKLMNAELSILLICKRSQNCDRNSNRANSYPRTCVQVNMTTGATIHTTEGLNMTVTRRLQPPIIPTIEMPLLKVEASTSSSQGDSVLSKKGEVTSAHS